jgi:hypothetical protein
LKPEPVVVLKDEFIEQHQFLSLQLWTLSLLNRRLGRYFSLVFRQKWWWFFVRDGLQELIQKRLIRSLVSFYIFWQ